MGGKTNQILKLILQNFFVEIEHTIFALNGFPHAYVITSICTNLDDLHEVYCILVLKSYKLNVSKAAYSGPSKCDSAIQKCPVEYSFKFESISFQRVFFYISGSQFASTQKCSWPSQQHTHVCLGSGFDWSLNLACIF